MREGMKGISPRFFTNRPTGQGDLMMKSLMEMKHEVTGSLELVETDKYRLEINDAGAFISPKLEPLAIAKVPKNQAKEMLESLDDTHYFEIEFRNYEVVGGRITPYASIPADANPDDFFIV